MTDGASSSAKRKPSLAPAPPAPRNEVVAPFAPGSCPNDPFRTEKSKTRHQLSETEKTPEKKIMVRKKARYPLMPTFSVASSPATASPCCVITIPIVFLCLCVAWARKIPGAEKPYQSCGYGENASMFLTMRFLHSGKITLCGKGSAQDWVAENS